ncbi:MAG: hypothetical protein M1832_002420 [Thelocarpon impressellum]|nr:MAG: hypothetical protein M1832_002420 [Thelocarpon impressellum]
MGQTRFIPFRSHEERAVGTQGLAGCTAVMVVSPYGAIVSHVPPTSLPHVAADAIRTCYLENQQRGYFPAASATIFGARFSDQEEGEPPVLTVPPTVLIVGQQASQMADELAHLGIPVRQYSYDPFQELDEYPGRGTVLVDSWGESTIDVYVDDELVDQIPKAGPR